jgi:hypothetical protein
MPVFEAVRSASGDRVLLDAGAGKARGGRPFFRNSRSRIEQPERHGFGFPSRIVHRSRSPFRHVPALLPDQPLPFPGDVQDGEVTRAERGPFDRETALFADCEPAGFHAENFALRADLRRLRNVIPTRLDVPALGMTSPL